MSRKEKELEIRRERVRRARKFAGYTQEGMAEALKEELGGEFSYSTYRDIEDGIRDFRLYEARSFLKLTGATMEFLTGESPTIEAMGLLLGSPVRVAA